MNFYQRITAVVLFGLLLSAGSARAAEDSVTLKEVVVTGDKRGEGPFMNDVEGTRIYAGKKATVTSLDQIPAVKNNNYRQVFYQTPGFLVSEVNNQGQVNVNYRGLGDPHESQDVLTLKDGLPIGFDRAGYSTTYYMPPMEAVERVEVIRGGGSLLYGPQPGPTVNYVTYDPSSDKTVSGSTQHSFGSNGTYGTYNVLGGQATERVGYRGYLHHSHSNGQRANEGFDITGGSVKGVFQQTPGSRSAEAPGGVHSANTSRWKWTTDIHESESGEPGRLTLSQWKTNRTQTIRPGDRIFIRRYASSLSYDKDLSDDTLLSVTAHGNYFDRYSRRRTSNTSTQNNLDRREAYAGGLDGRVRHDYAAFGENQTLTAGSTFYLAELPRSQDRSVAGKYPTDLGNPIFDLDYRTVYGAFFAENQFRMGDLSVIPSFRLDLLGQRVKENFNTGKTSPLHNINEFNAVPLLGIGIQHKLPKDNQFYFNASQGYKPPQFDDLAPTGNNTLPATQLDEGKTWTLETGVRGKPAPWFLYDASAFLTDYENFFGTVTVGSNTQRQNVGHARYHGLDLSGEIDLLRLADSTTKNSLSLYGNVSLLSANFIEGPLRKKEPAYAPNLFFKSGLIWRWLNKGKIALTNTWVEDHYWADDNAAGSTGLTAIPAYTVWDLTGEFYIYKDTVRLFCGINNFTDEIYFSRVRSDGIEPALERNYYGGISIDF